MHLDVISAHFNVTYRMGPLQTFTLSCACAASSSPIPTPTLPLSFAWHILGGAAACFFTGAAACFFDDAEAYGGLPSGRVHGRTDLRRLADLRRAAYRLWTDLRCLVPWQADAAASSPGGWISSAPRAGAGRRAGLLQAGGSSPARRPTGRTDPVDLQLLRASAAPRPELRADGSAAQRLRCLCCSVSPADPCLCCSAS
eukprot:XP_008670018.1 uncharacterized protein LOC103647228 isoform X2 [Zea mays]